MPAIELERVSKSFSRNRREDRLQVLRELSLTIPDGETLAIVGPSGCGKTTLLNILALLDAPESGRVLVDGAPRTPSEVGSLSLGYLFQRDALLPWRTAFQNALLGLQCKNRGGLAEEARCHDYFARFGLEGFEDAMPHVLSGGQRQRVAIIQNLLTDPEILLLDEPFGSLDYQTRLILEDEMLDVLRGRNGSSARKTVVLVTHDIEEAVTLGDRVLVMGRPGAGFLLDVPVRLSEHERDPVEARRSDTMKELFGLIWQSMRSSHVLGERV